MDNTRMEYTAEDLIAHRLTRGEVLVAKPKFDSVGADLLGLLQVEDGARFCRIQCKGRSLLGTGRSSVEVFADYVTPGFVLCLFVETGDSNVTHLFAFLGLEIRKKWTEGHVKGRPAFRLEITKPRLENDWEPYRLNETRVETIKRLIRTADATGEFNIISIAQAHVTVGGVKCKATATTSPDSDLT